MLNSTAESQQVAAQNDSAPGTLWHSPERPTPIRPGTVQIWRVDLDSAQPAATAHLSHDELNRADRFRHAESRAHFIAARSTLRQLLGHHLDMLPQDIHLTTTEHGKPALTDHHNLAFNLTHSGGIILIALAQSAEVGIDLEEITYRLDPSEIAERMFHPAEYASLRYLGSEPQRLAFFRLWSRKEAILKADGRGLSLATRSFSTLEPTVPLGDVTFHLHDLAIAPTHTAALATTTPDITPHLLRFPPVSLPSQ